MAGLERATAYKQSLEQAGLIRSQTEDERQHDRNIHVIAAQHEKEMKQMDMVDGKFGEALRSLDGKLDKLIEIMLEEQRIRFKQSGVEPTYRPLSPEERKKAEDEMTRLLERRQAQAHSDEPPE